MRESMTLIDSITLGIIEGITEFLPISSTGHLMLSSYLLGLEPTEFQKTFEISIQLGAILSVVVLYFKTFLIEPKIMYKVLAAFVPTAIIGFLLHDLVKDILLESEITVLWSLAIGGAIIIGFELWHTEKPHAASSIKHMTYMQAFVIGLFQSIALIPGVSRAAATIIGGLSSNVSRRTIVDFSFLLAVPTMLAATGLDLLKTGYQFTSTEWQLLGAGFVTSFLVAIIAIKWLLRFIQTHTFIPFGIYRILLALIFWFWVL